MASNKFPPPPAYSSLHTQMMTAKELREALETLWAWVEKAETSATEIAPSDQQISEVRQLMSTIISERVERHRDEPGRSSE